MKKALTQSLKITALITMVLPVAFFFSEPRLASAIEDQFTVTQVVTSEISFLTNATDVTMNGTLTGLTGGTSTGLTQVRVLTNDSAGYTMTIKASSSPAMQGNTQGGSIADYTPATSNVPDFAYSVPSNYEFGYTVSASTTSDLAQKFLDNGSTCNTGALDTSASASCWYGLSTTATSTVVRATATPSSGATTTIFFQLKINSGSNVPEDTYVATTTLTVTTN